MLEIGNEKRGYCFDSTEHKILRSLPLVCVRNVEESWAVNSVLLSDEFCGLWWEELGNQQSWENWGKQGSTSWGSEENKDSIRVRVWGHPFVACVFQPASRILSEVEFKSVRLWVYTFKWLDRMAWWEQTMPLPDSALDGEFRNSTMLRFYSLQFMILPSPFFFTYRLSWSK